MDPEDTYGFETAEQFWTELKTIVSQPCETDERIDDSLRAYIALTTSFPEYVETDNDLKRCAYRLYSSPLFKHHADYIRTQLVHCFLQDDESDLLYITSTFLLADAREHESTFELLNDEGAFQRMVELIGAPKREGEEGLHRLLMELLYEMARIQRITDDRLMYVSDSFICSLFDIIEGLSHNVTDPYHYPVIRVLLVLNEQYMVAAHNKTAMQNRPMPLTNKVIKVLSSHGSKYKTFGENIILLLNREDETSLQLLTLKLLYLIFTTPSTYEYFYTNDLHVLVDILVRNLLDLPEEATALRHTYLRVLHPLLEHTQLQYPPHYKRNEIRKLLVVMAGGQVDDAENGFVRYFEDVDDTTKRLVRRCETVTWLIEPAVEIPRADSPTEVGPSLIISPESPTRVPKAPPALPAPRKLKKRSSSRGSEFVTGPYLNPQLQARQSSLSMMEMAAQKEKPGVKTPSRNPSLKHGLRGFVVQKKEKPPPPPKARRSGWRKDRTVSAEVVNTTGEMADELSHDEGNQHLAGEDLHMTKTRSIESKPVEDKSKQPPPAPKTRRWRGKRSKDDDGSSGRPKEPGKFKVDLPSIVTTKPDQSIGESPFSPPTEKTLSPESLKDSDTKSIPSVSAALNQAQKQAIQSIEESFEKAHIDPHYQKHTPQPTVVEQPSPPLQRIVLAPPNQAPLRGVPGPTMELERSPFLTDNESDDRLSQDVSTKSEERKKENSSGSVLDIEVIESEDEWNEID